MLGRATQLFVFLFNIAFAVMALYFIFQGGVQRPASSAMSYADFVAILLTGLAVMIAVAAFFVAIFAVWGYKEARKLVLKEARSAVTNELPDELGRILTSQIIAEAIASNPGLLHKLVARSESVLFNNVDPAEANDIASNLGEDDR